MEKYSFKTFLNRLIFIALILIPSHVYCYAKGVTYEILFSLNLGSKNIEIGGFTDQQLSKVDDPFAYSSVAFPQDFTVDSKGSVIFADTRYNTVKKFDKRGKWLFTISELINTSGPCLVTVDFNDNIYVGLCSGRAMLYIYNSSGQRIKKIVLPDDANFFHIERIDLDSNGNIYLYSLSGSKICILDKNGIVVRIFKSNEIAVGPDDILWGEISLPPNENVKQFKLEGDWDYWRLLTIDNMGYFYTSATDKNGRMYLVISDEYGKTITSINPLYREHFIIDWYVTKSGDIYGLGINGESKKSFLRMFKVVVPAK